jgi:creatinine amidohydrolase/Fe(II)-dependent formamide hydrolase-like protein
MTTSSPNHNGKRKCKPDPYDLALNTFPEIEGRLSEMPSVLFPLAAMEPYGESGVLGVSLIVAEEMANGLAGNTDTLHVPTLPFGCSVPFKSFGGTAGVKPHTMIKFFFDICRSWAFQGFQQVIFLNLVKFNEEALEAMQRLLAKSDPKMRVLNLSFHSDSRIRSFIAQHTSVKEAMRCEYGLLCMGVFLYRSLVRPNAQKKGAPLVSDSEYRKWFKRGKDPQKFRKLYPSAYTSSMEKADPDFGNTLFEFILDLYSNDIQSFLDSR